MRIKLGGDKSNIAALNAFTLIKNTKPIGEIAVNTAPLKAQRDKRTQVITFTVKCRRTYRFTHH